MKLVVILIATVVALFAVANAVQLQSQAQTKPAEDSGGQLHQCSCDDQYKGFREWKNYVTQCFDQCRITKHPLLQKYLDTPVKLYSCLDRKTEVVHQMIDCVNGKFIGEESCVAAGTKDQDQMLQQSNQNFSQLFIQNIQPMVDQIHGSLQQLGQDFEQKYGDFLLGFGECARNCLFDESKLSDFWEQLNCLPKVPEDTVIQKHVQSCFREMNLKQTIQKICTCSVGVGVSDLQPFCQQLRTVKFPQWAEGGKSEFSGFQKNVGIMDEDQQQQFGGQFQQQQPRGHKLLVKLAIQEMYPDFQGYGSGMGSSQGSFIGGGGDSTGGFQQQKGGQQNESEDTQGITQNETEETD